METFDLLQALSETPGPSGFEADIAAVIQEIWHPLVDEISIDSLGNVIALKKGVGSLTGAQEKRPSILLAAHMDEIGLMVSKLIEFNGNGFLRVVRIGGVDTRHIYGQQVVVHGTKNLRGIIGAPMTSLIAPEKRHKPYDFETLVVDTGLSYEELEKSVSVGDAVTFHQPLHKLENGRIAGKSIDNRCSLVAVTHCLEHLQTRQHEWDVLAVATVQEEVGLKGAATSAFGQQPDIGIAIDVTFGNGPGANDDRTFKLSGGPAISYMPDSHPAVSSGLANAAKSLEMTVQSEYASSGGGTDAYALQIARAGIPTGGIGIPLRYMHTMVESIALKDLERVGRLLSEYICKLDEKTIDELSNVFL